VIGRQVAAWTEVHPLSPVQVDCATAVMLKILDGKCKMSSEDKLFMAHLYHAFKDCPGELLDADIHQVIATVEEKLDDAMRNHIYELRVLAETRISRPVMKGFKAMIREQGLFEVGEPV
jgi:hypothetical protein